MPFKRVLAVLKNVKKSLPKIKKKMCSEKLLHTNNNLKYNILKYKSYYFDIAELFNKIHNSLPLTAYSF